MPVATPSRMTGYKRSNVGPSHNPNITVTTLALTVQMADLSDDVADISRVKRANSLTKEDAPYFGNAEQILRAG